VFEVECSDDDIGDNDGSGAADDGSSDSEGWFPDASNTDTMDVAALAAMPAHMRAKYLGV
jgi:hypothetical protein